MRALRLCLPHKTFATSGIAWQVLHGRRKSLQTTFFEIAGNDPLQRSSGVVICSKKLFTTEITVE